MVDDIQTKAASPDKAIQDSVQSRAHEVNGAFFGMGAPGLNRLLFYRQKNDLDVPPYGYGGRGSTLRRVWRLVGADIIASALAIFIQKIQATPYNIEGPKRTVGQAQQLIDNAELGEGWLSFTARWCLDFLTQDNGAITEKQGPGNPLKRGGMVMRHPDGMPVIDVALPLTGKPISIAHMDSIACERTGILETPIRYYDINGNMFLMNRDRVHVVADMPQPDERLFGYGFCALSRCISMVQYAVNWATARNEALDNMPPLSIMSLENINKEVYEQQMASYEADRQAVNERVLRSVLTLVQQDPTKPTAVKLTPIRQLWESFDEQKAFETTVNIVSMAFGMDRQELAPLTSGTMGSGAQSTVLDAKARGKGVGNAFAQLEGMMRGTLPASCTFRFDRQDDEQDLQRAQIREAIVRALTGLYGVGVADTALEPTAAFGAGISQSINKIGLVSRDEARRILMHEAPEWADLIDPDMTLREQVIVDDLDPEVVEMQQKMYGPRVRYHSKTRRTVQLIASDFRQVKARRALIDPVSDAEIAESKRRLAAIGIDVDALRPAHAGA